MNRKMIIAVIVLAVLAVVVAFILKVLQTKKTENRVSKVSPYTQQTSSTSAENELDSSFVPPIDPETVPTTADYKINFADLYGKAVRGTSTISVNDNTFTTQYQIEIEGIAPSPAKGKYNVWLESDEGVRTQLGVLAVNESKVGTLQVKGGRPEANWVVMISFKDESKTTEDPVYRGVLEPLGL